MSIYADSSQLYTTMQRLFSRIKDQDARSMQTVLDSRLVIRLKLSGPYAEIVINGRQKPVEISYGSSLLRPDLDVDLTADALHYILLGELRLRKALASGQMKVRGPLFKTFALEQILHTGQSIYPQIYAANL